MQAPLPQVTQEKLPEEPKVLLQQLPQAPKVGPPQERLPEVVIPKAAAKKLEPAPKRTLRDRGTERSSVRFETCGTFRRRVRSTRIEKAY